MSLEVLAKDGLRLRCPVGRQQLRPKERPHGEDKVTRLIIRQSVFGRGGLGQQRYRLIALASGACQSGSRLELANIVQGFGGIVPLGRIGGDGGEKRPRPLFRGFSVLDPSPLLQGGGPGPSDAALS